MILETAKFGEIEYKKSDIILMVRGILGFEDLKRFIIVAVEGQEPFKWLQSVENSELAFLMLEPLFFKPDYVVDINPKDLKVLGITKIAEAGIFVLITIPAGRPEKMSANLQAPVVMNSGNKHAAQLILADSEYGVEHYIFADLESRLMSKSV